MDDIKQKVQKRLEDEDTKIKNIARITKKTPGEVSPQSFFADAFKGAKTNWSNIPQAPIGFRPKTGKCIFQN